MNCTWRHISHNSLWFVVVAIFDVCSVVCLYIKDDGSQKIREDYVKFVTLLQSIYNVDMTRMISRKRTTLCKKLLKNTANEKPVSDFPPFLDTWSKLQTKYNKVFGKTRQEIVLKSKFVHARHDANETRSRFVYIASLRGKQRHEGTRTCIQCMWHIVQCNVHVDVHVQDMFHTMTSRTQSVTFAAFFRIRVVAGIDKFAF